MAGLRPDSADVGRGRVGSVGLDLREKADNILYGESPDVESYRKIPLLTRRQAGFAILKIFGVSALVGAAVTFGVNAARKASQEVFKKQERVSTIQDFEEKIMREFKRMDEAEDGRELLSIIAKNVAVYSQDFNNRGEKINFLDRRTWKDTKLDLYLRAWVQFIENMLTYEGRHGYSQQNREDLLAGGLASFRRVFRRIRLNRDLQAIIRDYDLPVQYNGMINKFDQFLTLHDYPQNVGEGVFWQYLITPPDQLGLGMNEKDVETFKQMMIRYRDGSNFTLEIEQKINERNQESGFQLKIK